MYPFHKDTPRKVKARGMGEIITLAMTITDDKKLGARVRLVVERVMQEEAAWRAGLDANGAPLKPL